MMGARLQPVQDRVSRLEQRLDQLEQRLERLERLDSDRGANKRQY
jgi:hypothetical protein